jgi:glycosyltransferase involved in cell wall biosynthesis
MSKNKGVKNAKGKWITFLDSDDILQPETFERMVEVIINNDSLNFIFTDFQYVSIGNEFKKADVDNGTVFFNKFEIQDRYLLRSQIILSPGTLYNKEWFCNNDLFFKKIPYSMDQLFVWEMLLKVDKIAKIRKPLYNYLQRPGSIMSGSKYTSIIKGYPEFKKIQEKYLVSDKSTELTKRYLLSRWVMGILHSGARLTSRKEYRQLLRKLDAKEHSKNMLGFPSIKLKVIALIILYFPSVSYWVFRKI